MKHFALATIFLLGLTATPISGLSFLLGSLRCVQGPSRWCRDVETAKECRAEEYCKKNVWNQNQEETKHTIRKNDAGEVIFSTFDVDRPSKNFDDAPFQTMEKIVDMQMKEMEGMMKTFMGGEGDLFNGLFSDEGFGGGERSREEEAKGGNAFGGFFRSVIQNNRGKMDNNNDINNDNIVFNEKEDDVCGACVNLTTEIRDKFLTKANEKLVMNQLDKICEKLGPLGSVCSKALNDYVPKYFDMLRDLLTNPKIVCELLGLCEGAENNSPVKEGLSAFPTLNKSPPTYQVAAKTCTLCSSVAQGLKSTLKIQGFADSLPKTVCGIMKRGDDVDCLELLSSFVVLFHEHLDPSLLCASSFCSNSGVDALLEDAEDRLFEDEDIKTTEAPTTEAPTTEAPTTAPPPPPPKPLPRACKSCIRHTKMSIRKSVRKVLRLKRRMMWGCKFALNKTKCREATEAFIENSLKALKKMCPYKICVTFGYCPPKKNSTEEASEPNGFFVEEIDIIIDPQTMELLTNGLKSVPMLSLEPAVESLSMQSVEDVARDVVASAETASRGTCENCEMVVNYAKILLGNPDVKKEVIELLSKECKKAGVFQDNCDQFVKHSLEPLLEKIVHMDTKQTCISLHLCPGSTSFQTLMSSVAASTACSTCKSFVKTAVMPQISNLGSERDFAVGFCHLVGLDDLLCHKRVASYLSVAKSYEVNAGDRICQPVCRVGAQKDLQECLLEEDDGTTQSITTAAPTTEASTKEVPTTEAPTTEAPTTEAPTTTPPPPPQPLACTRCIEAVTMIKEKLTKRLKCLKRRLGQACHLFPPLKAECDAAVVAFFRPLEEKIDQVDPNVVCVKAGLCIPSMASDLRDAPGTSARLTDVFGGIGPVIPAEDVFPDLGFLDTEEKPPKTAEKDDGKIRIKNGGSKRDQQPQHARNPEQQQHQVLTMGSKVSGDAACTVCNYLVDDLKDNWSLVTREELKALMMKGCTELPKKQQEECLAFLAPLLDQIIDAVVEGVPAKEICQIATVCPSSSSAAITSKLRINSMQCFACKFAVGELKDVWSNPNVPSTINDTLHSICLKLPTDYQPQCHGAIDQTFPVIDAMLKEMQPEAVCSSLGVCEVAKLKLFGANECNWHVTPDTFCVDWKLAKKCNQIKHCKNTVWARN